ncbi:MAG TPA: type II secretion system protein, partial [Pirellulaceae bacterium]|nr:type II secretion system protein [Pirellulaceae bacterium]
MSNPVQRAVRRGMTLIELILVIGLLALVASLMMPAIFRSLAHQKLDKAADLVRSEMGRARVQAIRTGKIHALVYAPGDNRLAVEPFDSLASKLDMGNSRVDFDPRESDLDFSRERLPRDVLFVGGESKMDARSAFEMEQVGNLGSQMIPVLFYPDGTSQDAKVYLANRNGDLIMVSLRGLTGSTRV